MILRTCNYVFAINIIDVVYCKREDAGNFLVLYTRTENEKEKAQMGDDINVSAIVMNARLGD